MWRMARYQRGQAHIYIVAPSLIVKKKKEYTFYAHKWQMFLVAMISRVSLIPILHIHLATVEMELMAFAWEYVGLLTDFSFTFKWPPCWKNFLQLRKSTCSSFLRSTTDITWKGPLFITVQCGGRLVIDQASSVGASRQKPQDGSILATLLQSTSSSLKMLQRDWQRKKLSSEKQESCNRKRIRRDF